MYLKISWTKVRKSFGLPKVYRAGSIIKNFYYHLQRFGKRPTGAPGIGSSETGEKPLQLAAEPFPHRHRLHPPPMHTYEKRIPRSRGILFIGGYRATSFRVPGRSFCRLWRRPWRPAPPFGDLARGTFLFAGDASGFTELLLRIVAGLFQSFPRLAPGFAKVFPVIGIPGHLDDDTRYRLVDNLASARLAALPGRLGCDFGLGDHRALLDNAARTVIDRQFDPAKRRQDIFIIYSQAAGIFSAPAPWHRTTVSRRGFRARPVCRVRATGRPAHGTSPNPRRRNSA